ncbi:MAG: FAD-containing oxidoreductase [Candidatus Hydrogenedentota bacterium]|nr:MAG: FAD-containing oxidoreductase [Candidatus Hydrogenedentota bacterium]
MGTFDVVVLGAGPGGLVAAAGLAGLGASVALVERHRMGGDCLNYGCVPSKALIRSARVAAEFRNASRWGLPPVDLRPDLGAVLERARSVRASLAPKDSAEAFEAKGVSVLEGTPGRLVSPREVLVGNRHLKAKHIVLATGACAAVPPIPGLKEIPYHTNETFFDTLDPSIRSLIVLGGGPIGCEIAQSLAQLGVEVTLVQHGEQLLPREDPDVAGALQEAMKRDGVRILLSSSVETVSKNSAGRIRVFLAANNESKERLLEGDALLVAAGRKANIDGIGLKEAGVECTPRGVLVDEFLRTSRKSVWAVGDVIGGYQFTHYADAQARIVVRNIVMPFFPARFRPAVIPWCTFTSPEVARAGVNEKEARAKNLRYRLFKFPLSELDRPVCDGTPEGFVKVLVEKNSDRILGVTAVGHGAGDWFHELVLAVASKTRLSTISEMIHAYPTWAEANRRVADEFMRTKLTPFLLRTLRLRWKLGF